MVIQNVRKFRKIHLTGFVLLVFLVFSAIGAVFAADSYYFIFTGADSVVCSEPEPGTGNINFNVTANYSLLPDETAGTQGFTRTRLVDGVAYAQDSTGFTVYGSGVYMSPTSHPPYAIPSGATSYLFTLKELLIVDGVETSITSVTVKCELVEEEWVGSFVGVTGDPDIDAADTGGPGGGNGNPPDNPGDEVPDNPSHAGDHSNSHACEDNPGRANEHRPDNAPPC